MNDFLIRDARVGDAEIIADFNVEMARETEHRELDAQIVLSGVRDALENPEKGFYLVATDEAGETVAALLVTYEWSDWRNATFWWIQSVYVVPEWRGRGIYRALYAQTKARAQNDPNVCGLRLYVERDNANAQAVYAKLGMSETPYRVFEEEF